MKKIILGLVMLSILILSGCNNKSSNIKEFSPISLSDIYYEFYNCDLTDLQKNDLWETKYKDKYVRWETHIKSVKKRNIFTENDLMGYINSYDTTRVGVKFQKSELPKLLSYNIREIIYFEGRLDSRLESNFLNSRIFYIKDAIIIHYDNTTDFTGVRDVDIIMSHYRTYNTTLDQTIHNVSIYNNMIDPRQITLHKDDSITFINMLNYTINIRESTSNLWDFDIEINDSHTKKFNAIEDLTYIANDILLGIINITSNIEESYQHD